MTVCRCCKDALQSQWRHFLIARKLGTTEFLCRLTTKKSMCFANPVTMKGQWSLLLTRDQIVQQKRPFWRRAPIKQCTCYLSLIILLMLTWKPPAENCTGRLIHCERKGASNTKTSVQVEEIEDTPTCSLLLPLQPSLMMPPITFPYLQEPLPLFSYLIPCILLQRPLNRALTGSVFVLISMTMNQIMQYHWLLQIFNTEF